MADIVIDTIANKFPPKENFKEGSQFINIDDSKLYVLDNNDWVEVRTINPGEFYKVKSLDNALFKVNDVLGLQRVDITDAKDTKTVDDDEEKSIIGYFLKRYAPKTSGIFENNNITFSSMEIFLPIILDNYKSFVDQGFKSGQGILNNWLNDNGFVKDGQVTDKELSTEDLRNFAVVLCEGLAKNGKISDNTIGYSNLLGDLLNTKYNVSIRGVENEYSLEDIFDKLRNQKYLYSSKKDIALRNIINHRFAQDTFGVGKDSEGRAITFAQTIMTQLTSSWFNLIGRDSLISELSKNEFIKQNLGSQLSQLNQKNINCWNFYSVLSEIYKSLVSNNVNDNVVNTVKIILDKYNPDSLVFLTERLMEVAANANVQHELKSLSEEDVDDVLKSSYTVFANSKEKLRNLKKLKSLMKQYGFFGYDDRATLKVNPNKSRLRNNILVDDKKLIEPKTLDLIDTEAWKYLLIPEAGIDRSRVDQRLEALDENVLGSIAESLRNEFVIKALEKYYTSSYIKDYLKEKDVKLEDSDYDYTAAYEDRLYSELNSVIKSVDSLKPAIQRAQSLVDAVVSQKQNRPIDEKLLVNDVTATDLHVRDMLKNIRYIIDALGMYIEDYKDSNLANLSFDDLVKDMKGNQDINNLFTINYTNLVNLIKGNMTSEFAELTKSLVKFDNLDNINLEKVTDEQTRKNIPPTFIQEAKEKASDLVSYIEKAVMNALGKKQSESKLVKPIDDTDDLDVALKSFGTYNNFLGMLRQAIKVDANELEEFLKTLQQQDNVMLANKNSMTYELNKDMSLLYTTAQSIKTFLNINDVNKIKQSLQDLISQASKYSSIYPEDIDLDFVKLNFNEIANIIEDILTEKETRYSYENILKNILDENKDLTKVTSGSIDIKRSDILDVFKKLNIDTFDEKALQSIVEASSISADDVISYIANKLFYKYRQSLGNVANDKDKTSLLEYLDYQKFNLTLDIADHFSNNKFSDILKTLQLDATDKKYFMNAETVYGRLKNKKLYRTVPDAVIKAIANYKVLDYVNISLYNQIMNSSVLKQLLDDCEDWDFSDRLINNVLPECVLFDVEGNIIDTKNSKDLLAEVKANVVKPLEYKYINVSDNIFRSIFNKLKDLNRYSLKKNAIVAARLISSVVYQKGSIRSSFNFINKGIHDKLADKNIDKDLSNELITISSELDTQVKGIETKIDEIYKIAETQLKEEIPEIKNFINQTISNDPILKKYTYIKFKYDKISDRYSLINDERSEFLPIDVQIDYKLIGSEQQKQLANYTEKGKFEEIRNKLNTTYDILGKTFYNAMAKNLGDSKIDAIQALIHKVEALKSELNAKVSSKVGGNLITDEAVENSVKNLKAGLESKLMVVNQNSDKCFELTDELSTLLSDVILKIEKTKTLLV